MKAIRLFVPAFVFLAASAAVSAKDVTVLVEAERFSDMGGWVLEQSFMDQMGSPYLLAHGSGRPVADASTEVFFPSSGTFSVWVRTYNWTSPWHEGDGPGKFQVGIDGDLIPEIAGDKGSAWAWVSLGTVKVRKGTHTLTLHDLTGFEGRVDALCFTTGGAAPPEEAGVLARFREKYAPSPVTAKQYDFVVVGGGIAGMCAAISAARLGVRTALINDRPVWGGNNSTDVRVPLQGRSNFGEYPNLGNLLAEFSPKTKLNVVRDMMDENVFMEARKEEILSAESNLDTFTWTRAVSASVQDGKITSVTAVNVRTGEKTVFSAPLFADCTGDGNLGFMSGADWRMGREARRETGEYLAPEEPDGIMPGGTIQWFAKKREGKVDFPEFRYGMDITRESCQETTYSKWNWESGIGDDPIKDAEKTRDLMFLAIYSNWSFLKNDPSFKGKYDNWDFQWVEYVLAKRESRRLMGDYVLTENDIEGQVPEADATAVTSWPLDMHFPEPFNRHWFGDMSFKVKYMSLHIYPYPVPYRCLYSRNVDNLFMAGRDISVTHAALLSTRIMRTCGMLGEVVGMAASVCKAHGSLPRSVYSDYFEELKVLMAKGVGASSPSSGQE